MSETKRILLDCDGVIINFVDHLIKTIESKISKKNMKDWSFFSMFSKEELDLANKALSTSDFWLTQPAMPGALKGIEKLRKSGHEIIFVTAPWYDCETWCHSRRKWLMNNAGAKAKDVVMTERKDLVCGDVLVDDKPANLEGWQKAWPNGKIFVYRAPYNKTFEAPRWSWSKIPNF